MTLALHGKSKTRQTWLIAIAVAMVAFAALAGAGTLLGAGDARATGGTVVVKPSNMNGACQTLAVPYYCFLQYPNGWLFYNDELDQGDLTLGSFVAGPGAPAGGVGSAQISVTGTQRRNLATYQFAGTPLASITTLAFSTYNPSAGNGGSSSRSAYLQFNVDFNGSDTWQKRLTFVPSTNTAVTPNLWKEWNAINGGNALWTYSGAAWPTTGQPGATPKTWAQILLDYPTARVRVTDGQLSMRVGEPYADGYTENIDSLKFGTAAGTTTYDFEPETACTTVCYVNAATGNDAFGGDTSTSAKKTIQAAVTQVTATGTVRVAAGTYPEQVVINKDITLAGAGQAQTLITGNACTGNGITLGALSSGATIQDVGISGFDLGIQIPTGPLSNITVQDVTSSSNCHHGIWVQAFGTTNFAFTRVTANNNGIGVGGRGIWMINGVKTDISITDGKFSNNGLVGIDISDGNVTGLTVTGNTVVGNVDSGIGVLGAQGPGANLIANNTVTNNGRYGIEIKIPTGSGAASGAGSVVVSGNTVSRTLPATDVRDHAGIAVFRRSVTVPINADQPTGVVVTGNTVSGYHRTSINPKGDGFGIVVEGIGHLVTKNLLSDNDIAIQIQAGNPSNPTGDSLSSSTASNTPWFDRGNAASASALINRNSITSNTDFDLRNVGVPLTDATCNWYGAPSGPVPARVSGSFTTSPSLVTSNLNGPCPNTAPVLTITAPAPGALFALGATVALTSTYTDATPLDPYTCTIAWDDGTANSTSIAVSGGSGTCDAAHSYTAAGVYTISVTVADGGGGSDTETVMVIVYDPSAGFVTGGGTINSLAGAYPASPTITGKASFGFVSKYVKGKTLPTGNTEFQFQAAGLNFSSTAYEWLVVTGNKAQYRGSGTLNGVAGYTFKLTAWDAPGGDKIRMQIWDSANTVVYDNRLGQPEDIDNPSGVQGLLSGSIVIHN